MLAEVYHSQSQLVKPFHPKHLMTERRFAYQQAAPVITSRFPEFARQIAPFRVLRNPSASGRYGNLSVTRRTPYRFGGSAGNGPFTSKIWMPGFGRSRRRARKWSGSSRRS